MLREKADYNTTGQADPPEVNEADSEVDFEAIKSLITDLNLLFPRLANKNGEAAKELDISIDILASMLKEKATKAEFKIYFISLVKQIKTLKVFFGAHETSVSNLCNQIIDSLLELSEA